MYLQTLSLVEFRNFHRESVSLRPRVNFFVGDNGQGKTNFIEAVHLLSRGQSFRPTETHAFLRKLEIPSVRQTTFALADSQGVDGQVSESFELSAPIAKLKGEFLKGDLSFQVEMVIQGTRKIAFINGKRVTSADLMRTFPCVLFSPESLSAIKDGPEQRRILADELILLENPSQAHLLYEFSKCLKSRNRILRRIANGEGRADENIGTLESLTKIFLMLATSLTSARIHALLAMHDDFSAAMQMINDDINVDISADYLISGVSAMTWSEDKIFAALQQRQHELASQECLVGSSLVGPQKHDIKFLFGQNDSRFYCSQGQQRALIIAFKIAQIVYHGRVHQTYPVLLLDDVLSELDNKKRVNLMRFLESISAQVLITSTDLTWSDQFAAAMNSIFNVSHGHIGPLAST